jgi:hypothetical protein
MLAQLLRDGKGLGKESVSSRGTTDGLSMCQRPGSIGCRGEVGRFMLSSFRRRTTAERLSYRFAIDSMSRLIAPGGSPGDRPIACPIVQGAIGRCRGDRTVVTLRA